MTYHAILEAARSQNKDALTALLEIPKSDIDVFKESGLAWTAGSQLAFEKDLKGLQYLIDHGAKSCFIAMGFAYGGHIDEAESLLEEAFHHVILGAAYAGNKDYLDKLRLQMPKIVEGSLWSDIIFYTPAMTGLAYGGHFELIEWLKSLSPRGYEKEEPFSITRYAAQAGHHLYVQTLKNVDVGWLALGLLNGGQVSKTQADTVACLSMYSAKLLPKLVKKIQKFAEDSIQKPGADSQEKMIKMSPETVIKAIHMATLREKQLNALETRALSILLKSETSLVSQFLVRLDMDPNFFTHSFEKLFPKDIWWMVLEYTTSLKLDEKTKHKLGFYLGLADACSQLTVYANSKESHHSSRAKSLGAVLEKSQNKQEFQEHLLEQIQIIEGNNPYSFFERTKTHCRNINKKVDGYQTIVSFWAGGPNSSLKNESLSANISTPSIDSVEEMECVCASAGRCTCKPIRQP